MANGTLEYQINDIAITWRERERRVEMPCGRCNLPTKGRMSTGVARNVPYHMVCAINFVTSKALKRAEAVHA